MWPMKSFRRKGAAARPAAAVSGARVRPRPAPGDSRLTMIRPRLSEIRLAATNQPRVRTNMRPTPALSRIWATPLTRVASTRGAMIILIRRRKTSVTISSPPAIWAAAGAAA